MHFNQAIDNFEKTRQSQVFKNNQHKESSNAYIFNDLVKTICPKGYSTFRECTIKSPDGKNIFYDLAFGLREGLLVGVLESKSYKASLDDALDTKRRAGYDMTNILFQNMDEVLLVQNKVEYRVKIDNQNDFDNVLYQWINFSDERLESFKNAAEGFKKNVPKIASNIKEAISKQLESNEGFEKAFSNFYTMMKESLGKGITKQTCEEMLIQHKMTIHLFKDIFQDTTFLSKNPIAKALDELTEYISYGATANIENTLNDYFNQIKNATAKMHSQYFQMEVLRSFYEVFYQAYNPKLADTMGIVYTPVEVVDFMIQATDYFLGKHFNKKIASKDVSILDPCCGTGTFLAGLINFLSPGDLEYKYKNDLHANEMSIMAYYIANIYIEKLYFDKIENHELFDSFNNMCFVDTLDNVYSKEIQNAATDSHEMFKDSFNEENTERIKAQNDKNILVVIGNPPYNANQKNQNDNNPNKAYKVIDKLIKETYVKKSTSQKTKVYDMYSRFIRWATDRLGKEEEGMIAFITNRSFLDSKSFDGFRKTVKEEFTHIYTLDLGGDIRKNPRLSGPKHNVFEIQTGVCITFFIKAPQSPIPKNIFYVNPFQLNESAESSKSEKLEYLKSYAQDIKKIENIPWKTIIPDECGNWLNQSTSDFHKLPYALIAKEAKKTLFHLYSLGVSTNRDRSKVFEIIYCYI